MKIYSSRCRCLLPHCPGWTYARGLCRWHYQIAWRAVQVGETTWKKLVRQGTAKKSSREKAAKERGRML